MSVIERQLRDDYRLTTADFVYHLPDHPALLQSFIWQDYDLPPLFPILERFVRFWVENLDGRLHSVRVAYSGPLLPAKYEIAGVEISLQ